MFSVQRVSKSWNARTQCIRRTYRYFLPAAALGLALDGGAADAERLQRLADAWGAFQGSHPFHNYTRRRLYREAGGHRKRGRDAGPAGSDGEAEGATSEPEDAEAGQLDSGGCGSWQAAAGGEPEGASPADGAPGGPAVSPRGQVQVEWKAEKDESDLVVRRHYR